MITLVVRGKAKPGLGPKYAEVSVKMAENVRKYEQGQCLMYKPCVSLEDPDELVIIEKYPDANALKLHMETDHFKETVAEALILLAEPIDIMQFEDAKEFDPNSF